MSTYLLLRSNKQTGPFTLDEIRGMALKAYDLVWVEGKSAAWRYPGEIEELKTFAPLVEEQPFDRFFKKPVPQEHAAFASQKKQTQAENENQRYAPVPVEQPSTTRQNKIVFVDMPSEPASLPQVEYRQPEKKQIQIEKPALHEVQKKEIVQKSYSAIPVEEKVEVIGLEEKFSTSLDDLKKQYAENLHKRRNGNSLRRYAQPALLILVLLTVLGGGIFIGLNINNNSNRANNSTPRDLVIDQPGNLDQQGSIPTKRMPISNSLPVPSTEKSQDPSLSDNSLSEEELQLKEQQAMERKKARAAKQKMQDSIKAQKAVAAPKFDSDSEIRARQDAARIAAEKQEKENIKNNIEDYIQLTASKYDVGTFGGISDLQLTVSNTSPYTLDVVVVEVQYIQSNKKTYKTENLYFRNVGAGSAMMQEAPKSSRGVKVKYRLTMISSKENGISFSDF
ncbi:MAG TPA: hypothetical protein VFV08_03645 [Puia sp.]|nr:hypothetical protein [Puia sp.]